MQNDPPDASRLSPAEQRVLAAALQGGSVREIAAELFLTEATVKTHLAHIYAKLGLNGRLELLARFGSVRDTHLLPESLAEGSWVPLTERHPRVQRRTLAALFGVGLLVAAAMGLGSWLQPGTNPADLGRLAAAEGIQSLRLDGSTLWVTTQWSSEMMVRDVAPEDVRGLAIAYAIPLSITSASAGESLLSGYGPLLLVPLLVLIAGLGLTLSRRVRRSLSRAK